MTVLHEIIALATDIVEMPISTLTSRPQACVELVQRVQTIGKAWDEHPDWHGRNWYVQLLLAVAGLSRVVEWWEAEKQFWNFEEDNEDAQPEPLTFVMKGVRDTPEQSQYGDDDAQSDSRSIRSRSVTGELPKEPTPPPAIALQGERAPAAEEPTPETSHAEDTEKLRQQAEEAQSLNIVLELSLDRQEFLWINPAWSEVFGWGASSASDFCNPLMSVLFQYGRRRSR
jgi:serine/threonine-protein kinase RIM15